MESRQRLSFYLSLYLEKAFLYNKKRGDGMDRRIQEIRKKIEPYIVKTPFIPLHHISREVGAWVYGKMENMQVTNSFKIRGVMAKIASLSPAEVERGLVTASSGNHGKAVAYAAKILGIPAKIVLPNTSPEHKREEIRKLGAAIEISTVEERFQVAHRIEQEEGKIFIHPFDDEQIYRGQGTISVEIMEEIHPDLVLVPVGGGGLIAGNSMYLKSRDENIKVIGAEPYLVPKYSKNWDRKIPQTVVRGPSLADGLLSLKPGEIVFPIVKEKVDGIVSVTDDGIRKALDLFYNREKLVVEPSSAITLGAILEGLVQVQPEDTVVLIITGGNTNGSAIEEILKKEDFKE